MTCRYSPLVTLLMILLIGCQAESPDATPADPAVAMEMPAIETRADSIALKIMQAHGGMDTWKHVRYLRFDFGVESEEGKQVWRSHLWDRMDNSYRVEWPEGEDSTAVVLFNTGTREGDAYINGEELADSTAENYIQRGYRAFINDTYWLMAPVKLLDPGVNRSYVPDSSSSEYEVITLTYNDVGLTPEDQFWFWMDTETGMLARWAYQLQGRKDQPPTNWMWEDCEQFESPAGPVTLCPRKSRPGRSLMTDNISLPADVPEDAFESPEPML